MAGTDQYQLRCVNTFLDSYGKRVQTLNDAWIPAKWIKPDDPGLHPERTIAGARAEETTRPAARPSAR